ATAHMGSARPVSFAPTELHHHQGHDPEPEIRADSAQAPQRFKRPPKGDINLARDQGIVAVLPQVPQNIEIFRPDRVPSVLIDLHFSHSNNPARLLPL
ncbi:hypothetical protein, partial [Sphingomonas sp. LaA6.9]|uniref:hypothetical protein n=1 Tax=Sphingomonas sp. LaA6.9 TaxID=2919914 RepID=UPI001F4F393D